MANQLNLPESEKFKQHLEEIASEDVVGLLKAEKSYGNSWKKRGGVGAFMMLARKWDRLELQTKSTGWDIFKALIEDKRAEGVIDDIRDLRRYLMLVEAEMRLQNVSSAMSKHRDNGVVELFCLSCGSRRVSQQVGENPPAVVCLNCGVSDFGHPCLKATHDKTA